jgi:hypothetical protein
MFMGLTTCCSVIFWATGNDSDFEIESVDEDLPSPNPKVSTIDHNLVCDDLCVVQRADGEIKTMTRTQVLDSIHGKVHYRILVSPLG